MDEGEGNREEEQEARRKQKGKRASWRSERGSKRKQSKRKKRNKLCKRPVDLNKEEREEGERTRQHAISNAHNTAREMKGWEEEEDESEGE